MKIISFLVTSSTCELRMSGEF